VKEQSATCMTINFLCLNQRAEDNERLYHMIYKAFKLIEMGPRLQKNVLSSNRYLRYLIGQTIAENAH
jgi:hypothetical protein